jgi:hypothetical protein
MRRRPKRDFKTLLKKVTVRWIVNEIVNTAITAVVAVGAVRVGVWLWRAF